MRDRSSVFWLIGGHCSDGINKFTCICDGGYVGSTCAIDYDDCSPSPCDHGSGGSRPSDKGVGGGLKKKSSSLRASFWSKNKMGRRPTPRKLHWIRHCAVLNYKRTLSFCCTQQCTYNLLKVFSSDF